MLHPATLAASETRVVLLGERVFDAELIEGVDQPIAAVNLVHADTGIEPFRNLGEHSIALLEQKITCLLRCGYIDTDAAPAHPMHHRQQSDFDFIGFAGILAIEDWVETLVQLQRSRTIGFSVRPDVARGQLPEDGLRLE